MRDDLLNRELKRERSLAGRRRFLSEVAAGVLAGSLPASPRFAAAEETKPARSRLDRTNLLIYRDERGRVRPVRSSEDWQKRRAEILEGMQQVMGPLPKRAGAVPLDVTLEREVDEGAYLQRLISYATEEGNRLPAYLLVPKPALEPKGQRPGMLAPLGTGMSRAAFSSEALETEGLPLWNDHRDYARELAESGYVTLVPAYPHLGEYRPDLAGLGYRSGTMKAVWDNIRGLDLLDSLPFVRGGRYGAIGHSLGGHNSIYTAVFDERLVAVVSSCGFDSFLDYMDGNIGGWASERYMPRIRDYPPAEIPFDFHEVIAALAPRSCFVNAPLGDSNFKWKSAASVVETAMQIYRLYDLPDRLRIEHPDAGHSFPDEQRSQAYQFLGRVLS